MVFHYRVVTIDWRVPWTSYGNHKELPLGKYWQAIINNCSNCKYKTIELCTQLIETNEDHTNAFPILESKSWLTNNCERPWRCPRLQQQPQLITKTCQNMEERSKTCKTNLGNLKKWLPTKLKRAHSNIQQAHKIMIIPRAKGWGDIIQVKGNFPRGTCRVGCITKLIKSQD